MLTLSALTLEYIRVQVSATANGSPVNPTGDIVQLAFVAPGTSPGVSDWKTASWDTVAPNGVYTAQCLVGPAGTVQLAAGVYAVWVKVTDSPEIPVRQAGSVQIT